MANFASSIYFVSSNPHLLPNGSLWDGRETINFPQEGNKKRIPTCRDSFLQPGKYRFTSCFVCFPAISGTGAGLQDLFGYYLNKFEDFLLS